MKQWNVLPQIRTRGTLIGATDEAKHVQVIRQVCRLRKPSNRWTPPSSSPPANYPLPFSILFPQTDSRPDPREEKAETAMKRSITSAPVGEISKKIKVEEQEEETESAFAKLDENLLYEVLKHADARTLAVAGCVSKIWHKTALDERLWELICTRHWAYIGCGVQQLRSVVLALGGFRRLHSMYLWPLSKPSSSSSVPPRLATPFSMLSPPRNRNARWGKDEVHLSLSLLSIRYFEKMNFNPK